MAAIAGAAVGVAAVLVVNVVSSGDDAQTSAIDERVAELQAAEEERSIEMVTEVTDLAVSINAELLPVLDGLHAVMPVDGSAPEGPAAADDVAGWRSAVDHVAESFGDPPSASTDINTARNGLKLSVDLLASSLDAYEAAAESDGELRARLETLASDLRMRAVDAWSVAATQLDVLNIDAGNGHVHIYLPAVPGEEAAPPHDEGDAED